MQSTLACIKHNGVPPHKLSARRPYSIEIISSAKSVAAAAKSLQSCPTLCDPIDGSPPRLPRPWDSPGKNNGVSCRFLFQRMKVKGESEVA